MSVDSPSTVFNLPSVSGKATKSNNKRIERLGSVSESYIPSTARTTKSKKCDEHDNVCAICLEEDLNPTDETTAICLECTPGKPKHCFHKTCLTDYIKSKTLTNTPTECPICRVQISEDNLKKLNITKFVPTSDPPGQYTRANIPVPPGGFILPRLTRFQSSENVQILNQLRGYNFKVYKPTGGRGRFITNNNLYIIDNYNTSMPDNAHPTATWYVGLGNFMMRFYTDYVYVAEPPPAGLPSLYEIIFGNNTQPGIISTRYNELYSSSGCTVMGGKRRATKRRISTRRKGYKKRSTKRRGTRRRRR
jgi:hypothetical protein